MNRDEIIENLTLIETVNPWYAGTRAKGWNDDYAGERLNESISQAIELLDKNETIYMDASQARKMTIKNKTKHEQHKELCNSLNELYISKNKEYGDSFGKAYRDLGLISAVGQIYHKTQRLAQIYNKDEIEHESLEDNLMDLANYCLLTLLEINNNNSRI